MPLIDKEQRRIYQQDYYWEHRKKKLKQFRERYHKKYKKALKKRYKEDPLWVQQRREASRKWVKDHPGRNKYNGYRWNDKKRGFSNTLNKEVAIGIMLNSSCTYCGVFPALGLDRKDSSKGHSKGNVVPCCRSCNMILGSMPYEMKIIIGKALKKCRKLGFVWAHPFVGNRRPKEWRRRN